MKHNFLWNVLLIVGLAASVSAQTLLPPSAPIPAGVAPDVQIVVIPYGGGQWGVTAVYPKIVGKKIAQAHIQRLQQISGWKASGIEYEERGIGVVRRDGKPLDKNAPPDPPMTSVMFQTGANLVDWSDGTMAWEPFARAYRDKKRVYITYMLPAGWTFRGLRKHSDKNIDVALADTGAAYTYLLNIKNNGLTELRLPRYEITQPGAERRVADSEKPVGNNKLLGLGAILLLAMGAGVVTFFLISRAGGK